MAPAELLPPQSRVSTGLGEKAALLSPEASTSRSVETPRTSSPMSSPLCEERNRKRKRFADNTSLDDTGSRLARTVSLAVAAGRSDAFQWQYDEISGELSGAVVDGELFNREELMQHMAAGR